MFWRVVCFLLILQGCLTESRVQLSPDETFAPELQFPGWALDMVYLDGHFYVVLEGDWIDGTQLSSNLARLHADGTHDTSFDPEVEGKVTAIAVTASGKLLIGGDFTEIAGHARDDFALLQSDGEVDPSWASGSGLPYSAEGPEKLIGNAQGYFFCLSNYGYLYRLEMGNSPVRIGSRYSACDQLSDGRMVCATSQCGRQHSKGRHL